MDLYDNLNSFAFILSTPAPTYFRLSMIAVNSSSLVGSRFISFGISAISWRGSKEDGGMFLCSFSPIWVKNELNVSAMFTSSVTVLLFSSLSWVGTLSSFCLDFNKFCKVPHVSLEFPVCLANSSWCFLFADLSTLVRVFLYWLYFVILCGDGHINFFLNNSFLWVIESRIANDTQGFLGSFFLDKYLLYENLLIPSL